MVRSPFSPIMRRIAFLSPIALPGLLATTAPGLVADSRAPVPAGRGCAGPDAPLTTTVDSAHDTVIITLGPCRVPALGATDMGSMAGMAGMPGMAMMSHGPGHEDVRVHFRWPADVWMRSFDLQLLDPAGHRLNQPTTMHHMEVLNFDRRQLVYPMVERVFGMGEETGGAAIPKTVGLPLDAGMDMGLYVMWNNHTDRDLDGVTFRLAIRYSPRNLVPRPTIVLPFKADVNIHPGAGDAFDLPPGGGSRSAVFTVGASGRLLAVGGHLHDYGKELRLEDARSGKVLARVWAQRTPDGEVTGVTHGLYGVLGRGPHLKAGRPYRLVAVYEGSPADSIRGAMGLMGGIFAPDHYHRWPRIDRRDPAYLIDLHPPAATVATAGTR